MFLNRFDNVQDIMYFYVLTLYVFYLFINLQLCDNVFMMCFMFLYVAEPVLHVSYLVCS